MRIRPGYGILLAFPGAAILVLFPGHPAGWIILSLGILVALRELSGLHGGETVRKPLEPDYSIHQAIQYLLNHASIGRRLSDPEVASRSNKLDYATRLLTGAAREDRITIWGKPEGTNEQRVIESEEWEVRQVDHFCHTSPFDVPEYTARNMFQFHDLMVNQEQLERCWPRQRAWRRLFG